MVQSCYSTPTLFSGPASFSYIVLFCFLVWKQTKLGVLCGSKDTRVLRFHVLAYKLLRGVFWTLLFRKNGRFAQKHVRASEPRSCFEGSITSRSGSLYFLTSCLCDVISWLFVISLPGSLYFPTSWLCVMSLPGPVFFLLGCVVYVLGASGIHVRQRKCFLK